VKIDYLTEEEAAREISVSCGGLSRIYRKYQLHLEKTNALLETTKRAKCTGIKFIKPTVTGSLDYICLFPALKS